MDFRSLKTNPKLVAKLNHHVRFPRKLSVSSGIFVIRVFTISFAKINQFFFQCHLRLLNAIFYIQYEFIYFTVGFFLYGPLPHSIGRQKEEDSKSQSKRALRYR